jgi:hypothetical protein
MTALNDSERRDVWKRFQDLIGTRDRAMALTKAELRTAINQGDDWIEDNFGDGVAAITGNPSTVLTQDEKLELFYQIVLRRNERI